MAWTKASASCQSPQHRGLCNHGLDEKSSKKRLEPNNHRCTEQFERLCLKADLVHIKTKSFYLLPEQDGNGTEM
jgi:hypothetical protein